MNRKRNDATKILECGKIGVYETTDYISKGLCSFSRYLSPPPVDFCQRAITLNVVVDIPLKDSGEKGRFTDC